MEDAEAKIRLLRSELTVTDNGLQDIVTHVTENVDGVIDSVSSFFRFYDAGDGIPTMEMGTTESRLKMILTNSKLSFVMDNNDDDPVAYFSDNK